MKAHVPTSEVLDGLLEEAPGERVTIAWLLDSLSERSFGIVMLIMGLVALVPGASAVIGVLLAFPALQMILARKSPAFPGFIARRQVPTPRLARLIARINPGLRRLERLIRPRWPTPFVATKRVVGFVVLLLGITLLVPVPFSHVIPALVIMLLSLAYAHAGWTGVVAMVIVVLLLMAAAVVPAWRVRSKPVEEIDSTDRGPHRGPHDRQ